MRRVVFGLAMALAVASPALAQAQLEMRGAATLSVQPDIAVVNLFVTDRGDAAATVLETGSEAVKRFLAFCAASGIKADDVRSGVAQVAPRYRTTTEGRGSLPDDYEANTPVRVTVRDLPQVSDFVRAALKNGATRINGIEFGLADRQSAISRARAAAFEDARRKAHQFAALAHLRLGRVLRVTYPPNAEDLQRYTDILKIDEVLPSRHSGQIERGRVEVSAQVDVIWGTR